jgi:2-polyprenyl-3-methyl-5-hydroxy-6-metoxy-1,4-benzoquinol methylase
VSQLRLRSDRFRRVLATYDASSELAIRDFEAENGQDATRPAANTFLHAALGARHFGKAADLGCNNGSFALDVLVPRVDRLVLVDFSAKALKAARTRLPSHLIEHALRVDLTGDWKDIDGLGPYDIVSLCEVIQHMPNEHDRGRIFRKAAALLRPNGILLFSTLHSTKGEPREGFYQCDRLGRLLYWWRSDEAENAARFANAGLSILDRFREARVDAFVLEKRA